MEHSFVIKSVHDGTTLEFTELRASHYRTILTGPKFHGESSVCAYEPVTHLHEYFRGMATDWRGWQGKKEWSSLEGELEFSATIDSAGHISLSVRLRSLANGSNWTIATTLILEAGNLERIAFQVEMFFQCEPVS